MLFDEKKVAEKRARHFASAVGVPYDLAMIFASRIPRYAYKLTKKGEEIPIDGDSICFSVLDSLYELQGYFSQDTPEWEMVREKFNNIVEQAKKEPNCSAYVPPFERFVLKELLTPYMPRIQRVTVDELTPKEVLVLYNWVVFKAT